MKVNSVMSLMRNSIWRRRPGSTPMAVVVPFANQPWGPTWIAVEGRISFWAWGKIRCRLMDRIGQQVVRRIESRVWHSLRGPL